MRRINLQSDKPQVARSSTIRDINRQIVLNYVRELEPISRAEIARKTQLQRSTVSLIMDDLISDGFIEELGAGISSGGRKPTMLVLRKGFPVAIGIDITPTFTTIATADLSGAILHKESFPTNSSADKTFKLIIESINKIISTVENSEFIEIGVSLPGLVDQITGKVIFVPYFGWKDIDLSRQISEATGLKTKIDNDANAVALAELWFGKSGLTQTKNFITLLVAEGIGTGIVFDGQIYRGESGIAGEFGHMIVGSESLVACSCGSNECWEAFASDRATVARYKQFAGSNNEIDIDEILNLVQAGDEIALKTIHETLHYIGLGLSNLVVGLSPQAVIINGKISRALFSLDQELPKNVQRSVRKGISIPRIIASTLGGNPTLSGAISLGLISKFAFSKQLFNAENAGNQ
jgi:predicted NBD/HSP70 family sugar kinase/predicted transcriptional regulator